MIELDLENCREVLDVAKVAHIGCISEGEPYVTPISFVVIRGDIAFRTVPGRRVAALLEDPRVCIEVTLAADNGDWQSVIMWGEARIVENRATEAEVVTALLAKYQISPFGGPGTLAPRELVTVVVRPETMSGRASGEGLTRPLRPGRL